MQIISFWTYFSLFENMEIEPIALALGHVWFYFNYLLADLTASDDVTPQAQNMGTRSPMSDGSPKSVL